MPQLIAQGPDAEQRWRRTLVVGEEILLGRDCGAWSTPWDERISRQHARLKLHANGLEVDTLPAARNPIFFRGRKVDQFRLQSGEHFVIGATTFTLAADHIHPTLDLPQPQRQDSFEAKDLRKVSFRHPDTRIAALSRLPEIISGSSSDDEIHVRLVSLLMSGIAAQGVALVRARGDAEPIEILQWDRRMLAEIEFHPSERLIRQAIETGQSVVHVWGAASNSSSFTISQGVDWAFCSPMPSNACPNWAIYVTGSFPAGAPSHEPDALRDDLKFAELVASTFCRLREAQMAVRRHASLSQFLSPIVVEAIAGSDPETVLAPREADVSVMFCDLRGFTSHSEQSSANLIGLLDRVSQALGVMTRHILDNGGVIGDFHGDSAMGFWGWPLAQPDAAARACRAALAIREEFSDAKRHESLANFRIGIGIASGRAVAGKIGTIDQVKVTVFGPVVNLASRLENLTKTVQAPILLDELTAAKASSLLSSEIAQFRRVATVRPQGISTPIAVSELIPPEASGGLSNTQIALYESALTSLKSGNWSEALRLLHQVTAEDQVKDFLTVFIARHNRIPPVGWDGVINLAEK